LSKAYLRELIKREPNTTWTTSQLVGHTLTDLSPKGEPKSLLGPRDQLGDPIPPGVLVDLALDRLFGAITHGLEAFDLYPLFTTPLISCEAIRFRQAIAGDLLDPGGRAPILLLLEGIERVELLLKAMQGGRQSLNKQRWLLDAIIVYTETMQAVVAQLDTVTWQSAGLKGLAASLRDAVSTEHFGELSNDAHAVSAALDAISYRLILEDSAITVEPSDSDDTRYRDHLLELFSRFGDSSGSEPPTQLRRRSSTHIDDQILVIVSHLFPEEFSKLATFPGAHERFLIPWIPRIERELAFYLAWIEELLALQAQGLPWTLPNVNSTPGLQRADEVYDLALAHDLVSSNSTPVTNSFELTGDETVIVVTGPNDGGKTTYARSIGQLYCIGALGLPVGARRATITRAPMVATVFSEQEATDRLQGRLESEIQRVRSFFELAKEQSLLIANEVFSSTSVDDAAQLGRLLIDRCNERNLRCIFVTFVDELARPESGVVSLVAMVDEDTHLPSHRLQRRPPQGRALALELALRYGLIKATDND
jgi:DNA mismatch repair protein MutS